MGGQIQVFAGGNNYNDYEGRGEDEGPREDEGGDPEDEERPEDTFSASYYFLDYINGIFIRAAVKYLTILSEKTISKQLLIDEKIIDANSDEASLSDSEVILITNYRLRIESALSLLQSWVRQPTRGKAIGATDFSMPGDRGTDPLDFAAYRRLEELKNGPRPMPDSLLPPDVSVNYFYHLVDPNYRLDRITKTMPTVLPELKLHGLHYYIMNKGELDYAQVQEVVAFLDKVMPYVPNDFDKEPVAPKIRALLASCPEGGHVGFF